MAARGKVRNLSTAEPPRPARPLPVVDPATTRAALLTEIKNRPALSLDEIVVIAKYPNHPGEQPVLLTGADLGHALDVCRAHGGAFNLADDGDTNLRLRGLADLIMAHEDASQIGQDAAYFLANTLRDLAAKLEACKHADGFNVFLRKKGTASAKEAGKMA